MILNPFVYQSGGGSGPILLVTVTGATATSVTATKSGASVSLAYDSTLGKWWAALPSTGTWTVTAYNGAVSSSSTTVSTSSVTVYETSLQLGNLPSGYTELEYLETAGAQYIDTGLISGSSGGFTIKGKILFGSNPSYQFFFGGSKGTSYHRNFIGVQSSRWYLWTPTGAWSGPSISENTQYSIISGIYGDPTLSINGISQTLAHAVTTSEGQHVGTWFLFAINEATITYAASGFRIYGALEIYSDTAMSNLVMKLYPAKRNSDNVLGMYDIVSNSFFVNLGTGSFIAGPEV